MASFASASDVAVSAVQRLIVKERNEILQFDGPMRQESSYSFERSVFTNSRALRLPPVYDPIGSQMCLVPENGNISLHNSITAELLLEIPVNDAQKVEFSPKGTYLITFSTLAPSKSSNSESNNSNGGNLRIWKTSTAELLASFTQKTFRPDTIQWTDDEEVCFKQHSNEISVYRSENFGPNDVVEKIQHKGFINYKVVRDKTSSNNTVNVAVFNPEFQGKPARVTIYTIIFSPNVEVQGPLNSRTIFGATEANLMWSPSGHVLLVHSHSDVDSSNTSYYGATGLYLMLAQGDVSQKVEQTKEGPIHDVKWSPTENKFVVSAGNMPCQSTLYNDKGEPVFQFGAAHRNSISFAPHGRFLCIAGFGNLQGEMDFYDVIRLKKLGSNSSHCATAYGWSPCSRYFMTATLAPRMNVDNCIKIFTYAGVGPVIHEPFDRAFNAFWRPAPPGTFPDRPATPRRNQESETNKVASNTSAPAAAPAPYRPPHSTGALANFMNRQQQEQAAPVGKVKKTNAGANNNNNAKFVPSVQKQRVIPGMAPTNSQVKKTNNNNSNTAKSTSSANNAANHATSNTAAGQKKSSTPAAPSATNASSTAASNTAASNSAEDKEKRVKAINKKLKQIQDIKAKQASGQQLDADQLQKLQSEATLLSELNSLS